MDTQHTIMRVLGSSQIVGQVYSRPLPRALATWYCYTQDGGHAILCAVKSLYKPGDSPSAFLVPLPVKTVERLGYELRDTYVVVDVAYSHEVGVIVPPEDEEF